MAVQSTGLGAADIAAGSSKPPSESNQPDSHHDAESSNAGASAAEKETGGQGLDPQHQRLAALLLNFLKQYHLSGEADCICQMLQESSADGRDPRPLGSRGIIPSPVIRDAIASFEVWKTTGCITMPAYYRSPTHQNDMECYVVRMHPDGLLDLNSTPVPQDADSSANLGSAQTIQKRRADPTLVRPRNVIGYYVPPLHQLDMVKTIEVGQKRDAKVAVKKDAKVSTVLYAFNGRDYGLEYLILAPGDEVHQHNEESGWAYGRILRRAMEEELLEDGPEGWYPSDFVQAASNP